MIGTDLLKRRFQELADQLQAVEATKQYNRTEYMSGNYVDSNLMLEWVVKARNLLDKACGHGSIHCSAFADNEKGAYLTNHDVLMNLKAVFVAAREDFEGGYVKSLQTLVQADVFGSELDQASNLLKSGYKSPAAVVAGVVLETAMRTMCQTNGIQPGKLNNMNAELYKAGAYNLLVNKRITTLADIRNNAAHGHPDQFTDADVADMIRQVESFLADHL